MFWPRNVYKCRVMYTNVYVCRANFSFLGRFFCVLPNSSSPSLMDTAWTIWGISQRFSGPLSPAGFLWARAVASQFVRLECPQSGPSLWAHKGYLFDSGGLTRPSPKSMQLSWFGRPKSTQVDVSRRVFFFFGTFFLMSQSVTPADSGSLTRFVPIRCDCLGFGRVATDYVGVFPFCRPLHACVRKRFLADFYRYRKMKSGQLTDVQRPSFGFRFSFGGSRGFSGTEETQLSSDSIITHDLGPQGATLPESQGIRILLGENFQDVASFPPACLLLAAIPILALFSLRRRLRAKRRKTARLCCAWP